MGVPDRLRRNAGRRRFIGGSVWAAPSATYRQLLSCEDFTIKRRSCRLNCGARTERGIVLRAGRTSRSPPAVAVYGVTMSNAGSGASSTAGRLVPGLGAIPSIVTRRTAPDRPAPARYPALSAATTSTAVPTNTQLPTERTMSYQLTSIPEEISTSNAADDTRPSLGHRRQDVTHVPEGAFARPRKLRVPRGAAGDGGSPDGLLPFALGVVGLVPALLVRLAP